MLLRPSFSRFTLSLSRFCGMKRTEAQFYKAIQTLLINMKGSENADTEAAAKLRALLNELNEHCWDSYGLDMEELTLYALCEPTLEPEMEPACILLDDWKRVKD